MFRENGTGLRSVGVGSPQYDVKIAKTGGLAYPAGSVVVNGGGSGISMLANAAYGTAYPVGLAAHALARKFPAQSIANGVFVFDLDPSANVEVSFLGAIAGGGDPNNLTAIARIWGMDQLPCGESSNCAAHGRILADLALTVGALRPSLDCGIFPVGATDRWQAVDTIGVTADYTLGSGIRVYGGSGADTFAKAVLDQCRARKLVIAVGQGAASPAHAIIPLVQEL